MNCTVGLKKLSIMQYRETKKGIDIENKKIPDLTHFYRIRIILSMFSKHNTISLEISNIK